jgi:LacI family transcriptional regulator
MNLRFGTVDFKSSKPLYLQVTNIIGRKIRKKEIALGQKLPTQQELHEIFNVSKDTIGNAISKLVEEGYVSTRPTHGTVVISSKPKDLNFKINNGICLVSCGYDRVVPQFPDAFGTHASPFVQDFIFGMEEKIRELGGYLIFTTMGNSGLNISGKESDVAGFILIGSVYPKQYRIVKKMNKPIILGGDLNQEKKTGPGHNVIASDDYQVGYMAAKHLTDLGHKKIAFISYKEDYQEFSGRDRINGYRDACREIDKTFSSKDREIYSGTWGIDEGYKVMKKLLKKPLPFTAMVCTGDLMWVGISKALREKGMKVPDDLSVVHVAGAMELTRIGCNHRRLGEVAVEQLVKRIKNPDLKPERVVVRPVFVDKGSTKKL